MPLLVICGAYPDIGKGTLTAATSYLLQRAGARVAPLKYDGFLNRQPDLLPDYHSQAHFQYASEEIFALRDRWAADNDLGYHERFLDIELTRAHQLTNGEAFATVFERESSGYFPTGEILSFNHVRDVLDEWVARHLAANDAVVLEVGGTVGDRESEVLFDALHLLRRRGERVVPVLVAPYYASTDEQGFAQSRSTKTVRQAAGTARRLASPPDLLLLRGPDGMAISPSDRRYIGFETGVEAERIYPCPYTSSIYELPARLVASGFARRAGELLGIAGCLETPGPLEEYCRLLKAATDVLRVAIPGRDRPSDSQISLEEALQHAAVRRGARLERLWLEDLAAAGAQPDLGGLDRVDALVVPDALADPALVGRALRRARATGLPTLAISHGADLLVVELARSECGAAGAFIEGEEEGGGELRTAVGEPACGDWPLTLAPGSLVAALYGATEVVERSRHQTWATDPLVRAVAERGLAATGRGQAGTPEVFELQGHPFYLAIKPRPEYRSRPARPSPPFLGLVDAALARRARAGAAEAAEIDA